jgi:hypothetical protein
MADKDAAHRHDPPAEVAPPARCKYCGAPLGPVPVDCTDATDIVCFKCNEERDGRG